MKTISLAAYGRNHDVSPQAASKWKAAGHLVIVNGRVVVDASDANLKAAGLGRYSTGRRALPRRASHSRSVPDNDANGIPVQAEPASDADLTRFVFEMGEGRTVTEAEASSIKQNALALQHTLKARRMQGELIEMSAAEAALFEVSRAARDAWLNFPARIGPLLAAELNLEPDVLVPLLAAHVHQQLADIGEPEADFGTTTARST